MNSDWWAWNMNFPVLGKRHSRIPRWPWHCMTVSVSSAGTRAVPVGKYAKKLPCRWKELIGSYSVMFPRYTRTSSPRLTRIGRSR